jgi:hypothetical protein
MRRHKQPDPEQCARVVLYYVHTARAWRRRSHQRVWVGAIGPAYGPRECRAIARDALAWARRWQRWAGCPSFHSDEAGRVHWCADWPAIFELAERGEGFRFRWEGTPRTPARTRAVHVKTEPNEEERC